MADDYYNDPILDYGTLLLNFGGQIANVAAQKDAQRMKLMEYGVQAERQQLDDMIQISNYRAKQAAERVDQLTAQNIDQNFRLMLKSQEPGGNAAQGALLAFQFKEMEDQPGFKRLMEKFPAMESAYHDAMNRFMQPAGMEGKNSDIDRGNLYLNRGKDGNLALAGGYQDFLKVLEKTPPEHRAAWVLNYGYTLESVGFDRATGTATVSPQDFPDRLRAALMSKNEGIPFYDVTATLPAGPDAGGGAGGGGARGSQVVVIPGSLSRVKLQEFGGREGLQARVSAIKANAQKYPLDAMFAAMDMAQTPGLDTRLAEVTAGMSKDSPLYAQYAGINPQEVQKEIGARMVNVGGTKMSLQDAILEARRTSDPKIVGDLLLLSGGGLPTAVAKLGEQGITVTQDAINRAQLSRSASTAQQVTMDRIPMNITGKSPGEIVAAYVGPQVANEVMPELSKIMQGVGDAKDETGESLMTDSLNNLEKKLPGVKQVVTNNPNLISQIKDEKDPDARAALTISLVQKAYDATWSDVDSMTKNASRAIAAGAAAAGQDAKTFGDRLGAGDPQAIEIMNSATVRLDDNTSLPAAKVFRDAYERAGSDFVKRLAAYQTPQAKSKIEVVKALDVVAQTLEPSDYVPSSATYYGSQAEFMRGVADEMAKRPGVAEVGFKNAAPDAAMGLLARLDAKVLSGIASKEESLNKMARSIGMTPDKLAVWWLGPGHTREDLWADFKQFVGE